MADYPTEACRSCGAQIIWAVTRNGKDMPVDELPAPKGNIRLVERGGMQPLAEVVPVARQFGMQGKLRLAHFVNCPQADRWRKR